MEAPNEIEYREVVERIMNDLPVFYSWHDSWGEVTIENCVRNKRFFATKKDAINQAMKWCDWEIARFQNLKSEYEKELEND